MKTMVKALRNVRDANGWHLTGSVFETKEDLGDAVQVLSVPKKAEPKPEPEPVQDTAEAAPETEPEKPKTPSRRRKVSE